MTPKPRWFRPRRYLHFDAPITFEQASALVQDRTRVAEHSFYPFVCYELIKRKVQRDPSTGTFLSNDKHRPVRYAAHRDSHIYAYYADELSALYERRVTVEGISDCVLAFRRLGRSNIDFAKDAFAKIAQLKNCAALALDVSSFFDNLDHARLKKSWAELLGVNSLPDDHFAVFRSLTRYSWVDRDRVFGAFGISKYNSRKDGRQRICSAREFREMVRGRGLLETNLERHGIPQGSPISALLSNVYMMEFDKVMKTATEAVGGAYFRYCDDILLIVPTGHEKAMDSLVAEEIQKVSLELNEKKTETRQFSPGADGSAVAEKPLQYLGFLYDGRHVLIRSAAFARYSERMKRAVRRAKLTKIKRNRARIKRGEQPRALYRRDLYRKYSHLSRNSFPGYGHRAARVFGSETIRGQLKPLWWRLLDEIER